MDFCHICPIPLLDKLVPVENNRTHLVLAHLIEENRTYANFYRRMKEVQGATIIMDNSAFEMYTQGKPFYPAEKLVEMGEKVGADYIVLPDYPGESATKTQDAALEYKDTFIKEGFGTFFVPQSPKGDLLSLLASYKWALNQSWIDYIAFSILNIPNAYIPDSASHVVRNIQTFTSRWHFIHDLTKYLEMHGMSISETKFLGRKKFHFLGLTDGPNEILLAASLPIVIDTWDSSSAIWAGLNGIVYDSSPTGLIEGKVRMHVDFDFNTQDVNLLIRARENVEYIESITRQYNRIKGVGAP